MPMLQAGANCAAAAGCSAAGHASLELRTEILDRTAQRLDGTRCMGAEGLAGAEEVDQAAAGCRCPAGCPGLRSRARRIFTLHGRPSRHGVHQPQDSRAKNSSMLRSSETMLTESSTARARPVPMRVPTLAMPPANIGGVEVLGQQEAGTGAAGLPALQLVAVAHAAGVVLEQLAGRDAERQLPQAGVLHLAGEAHQLGAHVFAARAGQGLVPVDTVGDDRRHVAQGLDVVHAGRLAPHADGGGEGRLGARVGATAFQRVDQRGFFTADVATGASVDEQLEVEAAAEDVLAQQAGGLGFIDGAIAGWRPRRRTRRAGRCSRGRP